MKPGREEEEAGPVPKGSRVCSDVGGEDSPQTARDLAFQ